MVLLERIPLPSLRTYTSISVLLLACAIYYAHQIVTGNFDDASNETDVDSSGTAGEIRPTGVHNNDSNGTTDVESSIVVDELELELDEDVGYVNGMISVMRHEFVWVGITFTAAVTRTFHFRTRL